MEKATAKLIGTRAAVFASTLFLSFALLTFLPSARARRQTYLAQAAVDGNLRRMHLLHLAGVNVNARASCCLPLFLAAGQGQLGAVRYLLDLGADVNAVETSGDSALIEAAYGGHVDVVKELVFRGANLNLVGRNGTALDAATATHNATLAELLRHYGAKSACELGKCA